MGDCNDCSLPFSYQGRRKKVKEVIRKSGTTLTVFVPAEVDHCFADSIREELDRRLQTEDISVLEFDFQNTKFMDSSGIGLLMGRYKLMHALGGGMRAVHAGERIYKILMLSGIHKIIPIEKEFSYETGNQTGV